MRTLPDQFPPRAVPQAHRRGETRLADQPDDLKAAAIPATGYPLPSSEPGSSPSPGSEGSGVMIEVISMKLRW